MHLPRPLASPVSVHVHEATRLGSVEPRYRLEEGWLDSPRVGEHPGDMVRVRGALLIAFPIACVRLQGDS